LQDQLNAIENTAELNAAKEAIKKVSANSTSELIGAAEAAMNALTEDQKAAYPDLEIALQAAKLVKVAKESESAADIAAAQEKINTVTDSANKKALQAQLDKMLSDKFKNDHSGILAENTNTVTPQDRAAINRAFADYDNLTDGAKELLEDQKADLDAMKQKLEARRPASSTMKDGPKPYDRNSKSPVPVYPKDASEKEKAYIDKMFKLKNEDLASYMNIPYKELEKATIKYTGPYIKGFEDNTFRGDTALTRIQLVAIFSRILQKTDADKAPINYYDMDDEDHWGKTYLARLESKNLFQGYPDGEFKPDQPMTRAEFAKTIVTFWSIRGYEADKSDANFKDMGQHWARDYANAMYNTGFMSGYEDGNFYPDRPITRSEAVTVINKLLNRAQVFPQAPSLTDLEPMRWDYGAAEAATRDAMGTLWE
jgi:hypothetical protein